MPLKRLFRYQLPLKNGSLREGLILQIGEGFGDIAPLSGYSKETLVEAEQEAIRLLSSFPHIEPILPSVRFALSCALQPFPTSIDLPINALNHHREGFRSIKLKLGSLSVEEAIASIESIPKQVEIRLDFNRRWTLDQLLTLSSRFSPDRFAYLEEPTAHFSDLLSFSSLTQFPIAIDESLLSFPYWDIPTLKALVIKPTILGHIPTAPEGVELIFSSAYESGVGLLHLARLAKQYNPTQFHGLDTYSHLAEDLLHPPPRIANGRFQWDSSFPLRLDHPSLCLIASAP